MTSLKDISCELAPEIILLAETHLENNVGVRLKGYTYFGRSRTEGSGGGVGIMVKDEIKNRVAPHSTDKDIELVWISVRRHVEKPIYIGVYYGKQESRVSRADIEHEMDQLTEELIERQSEGDILLAMDGNGKIGLMGEPISRNGSLLMQAFDESEVVIMNGCDKCKGIVTRQNTKKPDERSAIDFVVCTPAVEETISKIMIDEDGIFKVRGTADSDHNSIIISINPKEVPSNFNQRHVGWRIKAPEHKWEDFRRKLALLSQSNASMTENHADMLKKIEGAALSSIGKTTFKGQKKIQASEMVKTLRQERRVIKKQYMIANYDQKAYFKQLYIQKQNEVRAQMEEDKKLELESKIQKMITSGDQTMFWKEKSKLSKNYTDNWLITKDENGKRLFDPTENKMNIANYYEKLYAKQENTFHPYHEVVIQAENSNCSNLDFDHLEYNQVPSKAEILTVIQKKKNGKSTTDLKNEIIKGGGIEMVNTIYPLIDEFWRSEIPAEQWNEGSISSIWKGKGDKEKLENHRGITVSSAIGTIPEEIINNRFLEIIPFTQFQAGGRKGCSPCDHVFIIRSIISYALKFRRKIILTFYDVQKAYDRADVPDMMHIAWQSGVKGKLWRLAKALNTNLTARVKTKFGPTRRIDRGGGGKQGGQIIVTLFSKLMDTLTDDMIEDQNIGIEIEGKKISNMLFVDDVATLAEGKKQQEMTLKKVNEFATKHKIKWGAHKCNVLEIGKHRSVKETWKLGEEDIKASDTYKYLGDIINRNGTNKQNLEERFKKVKNTTREIMSCGSADIMRKIELNVCLKLHEIMTIPMMLNNCESWILTQSDRNELEKMELWALKRLVNLPRTTPSVAVRVITGTLYTEERIDEKQLIFLQKILKRDSSHWTHHVLNILNIHSIGWAHHIHEKLREYELEEDWEVIKSKSDGEWKHCVKNAVEMRHRKRLLDNCFAVRSGSSRGKSKTKCLIPCLEDDTYDRKKTSAVLNLNKLRARAIIMARFGMLDCASNFENKYGGKECPKCKVLDDVNHRLNFCETWKKINFHQSDIKVNFQLVYSENKSDLECVADDILKVWDLKNGKNCIVQSSEIENGQNSVNVEMETNAYIN